MSKFKRALSLLLCLVMLVSTFSVAASLVSAEDATATAGVSSIKKYNDLVAANSGNFVYIGTEIYEPDADGNYELTDYYVEAGMKLKVRVFLKTNVYVGTGVLGLVYDNNFFDITNGTGTLDAATSTTINTAGNADLAAAGVNGTNTGKAIPDIPVVKNGYVTVPNRVIDDDYTIKTADMISQYTGFKRDSSDTVVWECNNDEYFTEYYVTVRKGLADGTRGATYAEERLYTVYNAVESLSKGTRPFDVKTGLTADTKATAAKQMSAQGFTLAQFLCEDCNHIFTVGDAKDYNVNFVVPAYDASGSVTGYNKHTYEAGTGADGSEYAAFTGTVTDKSNTEVAFPVVDPVIDGYQFKGWGLATLDADGNVTAVGAPVESIKIGTEDATYVAVFTQNPTYEVKYISVNDAGEEVAYGSTEKYEEDETYTVRTTYPEKEGYNFLGWSTVKGDKASIVTGEQTMGTEAVKYYAIYEIAKFNVTFYSNGTFSSFASSGTNSYVYNAEFGSSVKAEDIEVPVRTGYDFAGWATEKGAASGVKSGELCTVPANNNTAYYAIWTAATYTVTAYASKADYEAKNVLETVDVVSNKAFKLSAPITVPEGTKSVAWVYADAPDVTFSKNLDAAISSYNAGKDIEIYPVMSEYTYSITYKVWDYANEEWVTLGATNYTDDPTYNINDFNNVRKTIDPTALGLTGVELAHPFIAVKADGVTEDIGLVNTYVGMSFSGENYSSQSDIAYGKSVYEVVDNADGTTSRVPATLVDLSAADVDDDLTIYIYTKVKFNITNNTAEFDENGKWTDNTVTKTTVYYPLASEYHTLEIKRIIDKTTLACPDEDYKFINFTDADGNVIEPTAETDTTYTLTLSALDGSNQTINNNFGPRTYVFYFQAEGNINVLQTVESYKIGDTFDPSTATFVNLTTGEQPATLPVIGVAAEKQNPAIAAKQGYKLTGWTYQNPLAGGGNITFPVTITKELLETTTYENEDIIRIAPIWEAMPYTATFYYTNAAGEEIKLTSMEVLVDTPLDQFAPLDEATIAILNAAAAEGMVFDRWIAKDGDASTSMKVGGREYEAVYKKISFSVYVDYNNGKTAEDGGLLLKRVGSATYGEDVEFGDSNYAAAGFRIRTETFARTNANLPSETALNVGWKVYYVENEADLYNPDKWHEGYNDKGDGSTTAYSILIYQAQWMDYSDFLVRINDTNGRLYMGISKDFDFYYWKEDRACDKDEAALNPKPDYIILLFTISLENGLELTPFAVNSSLFTIEGMLGLFEALGNAIGGLLGDAFEDIELPSLDFGGGDEGEGGDDGDGGIFDFDFNISLPC